MARVPCPTCSADRTFDPADCPTCAGTRFATPEQLAADRAYAQATAIIRRVARACQPAKNSPDRG